MARGILCLILVALSVGSASADESRLWKDATGTFQVEATLIKVEKDKAHLRRADGKEIAVPLDKLSAADRDFLANRVASDPFATPTAAPPAAAGGDHGAVVVAMKVGSYESLTPALVYREADGKRYLVHALGAASDLRLPPGTGGGMRLPGPVGADVPPTFAAIVDTGEKRQRVELEVVAHLRHTGQYILRGPAKDLPQPLDFAAIGKPSDGLAVRVTAYEIDREKKSFTEFKVAAKVLKVFRDGDGNIARFQIDAKEQAWPVRLAVIANEQGQPVGLFGLEHVQGDNSGVSIAPAPKTFSWEEPYFGQVMMYPESGDRKKIVWQAFAELIDPVGKVGKTVMTWKRQPPGSDDFPRFELKSTTEPLDGEAPRIELKRGKLSEDTAAWMQSISGGRDGKGTYLVGQIEEPNPGPMKHSFTVQIGYQPAGDKSGTALWLLPQTTGFEHYPRGDKRFKPKYLSIPGMDGLPLEMPRAGETQGGYQITSENTVPNPPLLGKKPANAPQPEKSTASLAGAVTRDEKLSSQQLKLEPFQPNRYSGLAAYSADGKSLYVLDTSNVLHKLDALSLQESVKLKLDFDPRDLQVSKAGVLVSSHKANVLWQLHPETLEVVREYDVYQIGCIGASPGSSLAFVIAQMITDENSVPHISEMRMIDLAQGKVLHAVRSEIGNFIVSTPAGEPFGRHQSVLNMRMTADGKYLFLGDESLRRLRIEAENLIVEEVTGQTLPAAQVAISDDGKLASMPNRRKQLPRGGVTGVSVLNGMELKEEVLSIPNEAYITTLGFDPKTGNIYFPDLAIMHILSKTGEKITKQRLNDREVQRILVDPRGDRFLACGKQYFTIFDLQGERLKE